MFFQKSFRLGGNVEKYGRIRQATDDNTAYPPQQWLGDRALILRCTYIAYHVS
jgi:hypothetical protein